jgi:hypothetical protein
MIHLKCESIKIINLPAAYAYFLYEAAFGNIKAQDVMNAAEATDGR